MSFLSGFIGGVAGAYNDERDAEKLDARKRQLAEYESQLQQNRMVMQETLREKFKQAEMKAKRDQDVTDAKTVQGDSEAKRVERAQGIINQDTGIQHTPDEVKKIIADPDWVNNYGARRDTADGKPTEWTEGGLINQTVKVTPSTDRTRAQELNDKADAAMGIGRTDMEKGFRDQGNLERQTVAGEAKTALEEKKLEQAARKQAAWEANETEKRANDARKDEIRQMQILAAIGKSGNSNNETVKLLTQTRIDLGQKEHNLIVQKAAELKAAEFDVPESKAKIEAAYAPRFDAISKERTQLTSDFNSLRKGLGLPDIKAEPKEKEPSADKFEVGKKYKDAKGNVATYMGNGKWN